LGLNIPFSLVLGYGSEQENPNGYGSAIRYGHGTGLYTGPRAVGAQILNIKLVSFPHSVGPGIGIRTRNGLMFDVRYGCAQKFGN
jgi:hypothetical protein